MPSTPGPHNGSASILILRSRVSGVSKDKGQRRGLTLRDAAKRPLLRMRQHYSRLNVSPYAVAGCLALASIWPIASTTASKVSIVEACRAL